MQEGRHSKTAIIARESPFVEYIVLYIIMWSSNVIMYIYVITHHSFLNRIMFGKNCCWQQLGNNLLIVQLMVSASIQNIHGTVTTLKV